MVINSDSISLKETRFNSKHEKKTVYYSEKDPIDYQKHALFVRELFPYAKRVLDVGVGFGQSSIELQKQGFIVTSMDKTDLGVSKVLEKNNIPFIRDTFNLSTDINSFDLIIGLHCCGAAELIIRNCIENDINFLITLCEIHQGLNSSSIKSRRQYIDYLKSISSKIKETTAPIYENNPNSAWKETIYYKKPFRK